MKTGIPIVDLADLGLHHEEEPSEFTLNRVAEELDTALSTVGFVYLKNHGIQQYVVESVLNASSEFFRKSDDYKNLYRRSGTQIEGYSGVDQEILEDKNRHEVRESYDVTSLDGLFPNDVQPELRTTVSALVPQLCRLSRRLLRCLALALGMEDDYFTRCHTEMCHGSDKNVTTFRSLYYPSLGDRDVQPGVERCGKHSDYGTVTLLFQDDMGGLEVLSGGEWIPATPIPGTILVNVGDLMQFWTSDRYLATVHRVRVPEEEIRRRCPRQSIAFFVHPDNDVMVSPLNGSEKHPPISALAHTNLRYSQTYKY